MIVGKTYECGRCGGGVHAKCLKKGLEGLCGGASGGEGERGGGLLLGEEEVRSLQRTVFDLQRSLFQKEVELDAKVKEMDREKARLEENKKWLALLLPPGLSSYFNFIVDIVRAQAMSRDFIANRRRLSPSQKSSRLRSSQVRTRWYALIEVNQSFSLSFSLFLSLSLIFFNKIAFVFFSICLLISFLLFKFSER
jgi:hypothetical protein